jgi:hypothetical protein
MGLLSSFFGKDQRRDLERARAESEAAMAQGAQQQDTRYSEAEGMYQPYAQQGQEANTFYNDVLMNRGDATERFSANPLFNGELASNFMAAQRAGNAAGWGAGKEALAGQRVFGQTAGSWLDRYRDQGAQGLTATNQMAGLRAGRGDNAMGYGATRAGNAINFGNAMAANRNTGINNLMGLGGLAVNAFTGGMKPNLTGDVGLGSWNATVKKGY